MKKTVLTDDLLLKFINQFKSAVDENACLLIFSSMAIECDNVGRISRLTGIPVDELNNGINMIKKR